MLGSRGCLWKCGVVASAVTFAVAEAVEPVGKFRSQRMISITMDICIAKVDGDFKIGKVSILAAFLIQRP